MKLKPLRVLLSLPFMRFQRILPKSFGLKTKITFLLIFIITGTLLFTSYLDFQLSKKAQMDLYLDRNLYIAMQIDLSIPNQKITESLSRIQEEIEEWLLSRSSLIEIDVFLFHPKSWDLIASHSRALKPIPLLLTNEQIIELKRDKHIYTLREIEGENQLEVVVPLHSKKKVVGGIRIVSSLDEAHNYLSKKKQWTYLLTFSNILIILVASTLFFKRLVGNPIQRLVEAMNRVERGDLDVLTPIQSQDELGELGRHFNRMISTIRESHDQNIKLLSQITRFNEELTQKVELATSELKRLHEALSETQRQLSQSEKLAALGLLTGAIAHQIGTPLNSISGYIQLMLQEEDLNPKNRHRLKIIESQIERLADSFKELLSYTSLPKPLRKPVDINVLLKDLIPLSEPWLRTHKIALETYFEPDLPLVLGEVTHLQTLFLNLITNAIDAMPKGGTLTIKTQSLSLSSSDGKQRVEISITDTGIGISEEVKKKIFDPFFTTKKAGEGMGLGLSICEKIVKDHAGRIEVHSDVGKGSTFYVYLPGYRGGEGDE
ncbi:MAG: HAMP domain-containing sensor histidine kinase [Thermodesulfobacteriota bacterium]